MYMFNFVTNWVTINFHSSAVQSLAKREISRLALVLENRGFHDEIRAPLHFSKNQSNTKFPSGILQPITLQISV